jgi:hypothetical protein
LPHWPEATISGRRVSQDLFRDDYVDYARCHVRFTPEAIPLELVPRLHVVAVTPEADVVACRSVQGWRFLPGGTQPAESLTDLAGRKLMEEAGARLAGQLRFFAHAPSRSARGSAECEGLDANAMAAQSVPPSDLPLLGPVRHLADCEQFWFRRVLAGEDVPRLCRSADGRSQAFDALGDPAAVAQAWDARRGEVAFAEQLVAAQADFGAPVTFDNGLGEQDSISVREVLVHMIVEYARHMGHADFLRERIDGPVGQ